MANITPMCTFLVRTEPSPPRSGRRRAAELANIVWLLLLTIALPTAWTATSQAGPIPDAVLFGTERKTQGMLLSYCWERPSVSECSDSALRFPRQGTKTNELITVEIRESRLPRVDVQFWTKTGSGFERTPGETAAIIKPVVRQGVKRWSVAFTAPSPKDDLYFTVTARWAHDNPASADDATWSFHGIVA